MAADIIEQAALEVQAVAEVIMAPQQEHQINLQQELYLQGPLDMVILVSRVRD